MSAPKSAVTKAVAQERAKIEQAAQDLDLRRQKQIRNQAAIIDRLLEGATYDDVFQETVSRLADAEATVDELRQTVETLRGQYAGQG